MTAFCIGEICGDGTAVLVWSKDVLRETGADVLCFLTLSACRLALSWALRAAMSFLRIQSGGNLGRGVSSGSVLMEDGSRNSGKLERCEEEGESTSSGDDTVNLTLCLGLG